LLASFDKRYRAPILSGDKEEGADQSLGRESSHNGDSLSVASTPLA